MFNTIIWASDGSEHAERALQYARELAEARSAALPTAALSGTKKRYKVEDP